MHVGVSSSSPSSMIRLTLPFAGQPLQQGDLVGMLPENGVESLIDSPNFYDIMAL